MPPVFRTHGLNMSDGVGVCVCGGGEERGLSEEWSWPITPISVLQGREERDASRRLTYGTVIKYDTSITLALYEINGGQMPRESYACYAT